MADKDKTTVTPQDLLKTLEKLEGKKPELEKAKEEPKVRTVAMTKTLADTTDETGSPALKKALEVSSFLQEFAQIVGLHNDEAISVMTKSIQENAEMHQATIRVMEKMAQKIEALEAKIETYGKAPLKPAAAARPTAQPGDVLRKTADTAEGGEKRGDTPEFTERDIANGLASLVKSLHAKGDTAEMNKMIHAAATFEATKKIDNSVLHKALKEAKRLKAEAAA